MSETASKPKRAPKGPALTIAVDQQTIDRSIRRKSSHCMISEAIKAAVPTARKVQTDLQTVRWTDSERRLRYVYLTPRPAQVALINFDRGKEPEPFEFRLVHAQVTRVRPKDRGPDKYAAKGEGVRLRDWLPVKTALQAARDKHGHTARRMAADIGVSRSTMDHALAPGGWGVAVSTYRKIQEWLPQQPEIQALVKAAVAAMPAEPKQANSSEIGAQARIREKDGFPTIVGGRPPPVGNVGTRRRFGLRGLLE